MPEGSQRAPLPVQLVATDLDGTLADGEGRIHPSSARAIRTLEAAGIPVLVATGRRLRTAAAVLVAAGLVGPVVALDGCLGVDLRDRRVFHRAVFSAEAAQLVLRAITEAGLAPRIYVDRADVDMLVAERVAAHPGRLGKTATRTAVTDLTAAVAIEPVLAFAAAGRFREELEAVLRAVASSGVGSIIADPVYGGFSVKVRPPGVSKWTGVVAFCADRGLDAGSVLAIGDQANDVELLEGAAVACAITSADPAVLDRCAHQLGPPTTGGWAAVLELIG
jgi:HAD superfamily hydrolase (TIGR01484 family)